MTFADLGLAQPLLAALTSLEYTQPTPIQAQAIPHIMLGRDLQGIAQTGTGKTAAFALPILHRLLVDRKQPLKRGVRCLVLSPTRELANQIAQSFRDYGRQTGLRTALMYGGTPKLKQARAVANGIDILVATPGRLMDHMQRRSVDLSNVEILILDEADRMLDMGFLPAIKTVLGALPKQRQTLLFSATFEDEIKKLAAQFMYNPAEVQCAARNSVASTVTHRVHPVDGDRKRDLLLHLLAQDSRRQTLVFSRTKHGADRLADQIEAAGFTAAAIHGNKTQGARTKALRDFKTGRTTVLVGTDVASRGLDIDSLPCVINYDLPMVAEDYIHRIVRTGRAGSEGLALSLVAPAEAGLLRQIQRLLKQDLDMVTVEGFAPSRPFRMGNDAPSAGRPSGRQPPRSHDRRPHATPARHAHAGPKGGHGAARDGGRSARQQNSRPGGTFNG